MAVEHRELAVGGAPDMREDRLGCHDATHAAKQGAIDGRRRAARDVRGAIDVEGHAPAITVVVALGAERIVGVHQGPVHLALNHAAKPK